MTEQEAIDRIHSVYPTGRKNGVENMRALMARLGNPQNALPLVHVAGTNGKGSCCAMIERMLREAGYQTGLYTSPYIERYHERIRDQRPAHRGGCACRSGGACMARGGGLQTGRRAHHRI